MNWIKKICKRILPNRFLFCWSGGNTFHKSIVKRFIASFKGFTIDEWVIFDLDNNDESNYLSEYDRHCFREGARNYRIMFDNKVLFHRVFEKIAPLNKLFAYKSDGCYFIEEDGFEIEDIPEKIKQLGKIVYKPISTGGGGHGFILFEYKNGSYYCNKEICDSSVILKCLDDTDNYLLEEYCIQSEFENSIFSETVNTLRIITVLNDNKYEVALAFQRLGADVKACADNASLGGLFCEVNIETGELSPAFSYNENLMFDEKGNKKYYIVHPITGNQLAGLQIPNFNFIKNEVCRIHQAIRYAGVKFVAWDIALTDDGYKVIEGNTSSGMKFLQFNSGKRNSILGKIYNK